MEVVGGGENSSVKLGPAGGGLGEGRRRLGEGAEWTRERPVNLWAGGIGKRWGVRVGLKLWGETAMAMGMAALNAIWNKGGKLEPVHV